MLKSPKAHSSNTFLAIPQVNNSVNNFHTTGQSVPLELVVRMFISVLLVAELGMEESTVGERDTTSCPECNILLN